MNISKKIIWIGAVGILALLGIFGFLFLQPKETSSPLVPTKKAVTTAAVASSHFSYVGESGIDALTLLQKKTAVVQDGSGLVVAIGRREAKKGKEFWAFYVNGKFAQVGPAEYVTKDSDKIEWKIEKINP